MSSVVPRTIKLRSGKKVKMSQDVPERTIKLRSDAKSESDLIEEQKKVLEHVGGISDDSISVSMRNKDSDFKMITEFLQECPVIICFHARDLQKMVRDTHYRNQFETGTSSGGGIESRKKWESKLFHTYYDKCGSNHRVKYGVIHINPLDRKAKHMTEMSHYGKCYFKLKSNVKSRCTFTLGDSALVESYDDFRVYTFDQITDLLNKADERIMKYFRETIEHHKNKKHNESIFPGEYVEAQIHGDIQFDRDIESVYIDIRGDKNLTKLGNEFSDKNGCKVYFGK